MTDRPAAMVSLTHQIARLKDRKKEFVTLFDSMTGAHSRPELWRDMIPMFALAISQTVQYRKEREDRYMGIVSRYTRAVQATFSRLLAMLFSIMDENVESGYFGDLLGDLFMELELSNSFGGQFFTPYHLCLLMAQVASTETIERDIAEKGHADIYEPASGAGATMIAMAQVLRERGIDYQRNCTFWAQEIDEVTAMMCYIQLSLIGAPAVVQVGNTLREPGFRFDRNTWLTPMYMLGGAAWLS